MIAAGLILCAASCGLPTPDSPEPPRLVVLVIVDQMRADFLTRFAERYQAGLARLLADGMIYENAHHAHALTWTGAGHAALVAGVHPSRSGIIGNSWWERGERARVGAVADPATRRLDRADRPGASPFRLRVSTLGDWLKAARPDSQVWTVAIKDRSAVITGGLHPDGSFWYDFEDGRFVTSDYYMDEQPAWVVAFDAARSIDRFRDGWQLLRDEETYKRSNEDAADGESEPAVFPHLFSDGSAYYRELFATPFGDRFTFDFVHALIEGQQLGADEASDLLIVGASSADEVGHEYGPSSREIEDYYLRLDLMLGEFFEQLDAAVGRDGWLLALSSDHGILPLPEDSRHNGVPAERHRRETLLEPTRAALDAALDREGLNRDSVNLVYANGWVLDTAPEVSPEQRTRLRRDLATALRDDPRIEDVFTWDEMMSDVPLGRPYEAEFRRSFDTGRSADLMLRFHEFDLPFAGTHGTNHGSVYTYDTHVPMIFLGAGTRPGRVDAPVWTVDMAPTLAARLGIEAPAGLDGSVRPVSPERPR